MDPTEYDPADDDIEPGQFDEDDDDEDDGVTQVDPDVLDALQGIIGDAHDLAVRNGEHATRSLLVDAAKLLHQLKGPLRQESEIDRQLRALCEEAVHPGDAG